MSPRGVATLALILLAPSAVAAQPTPERADLGSIARLVDNDRLASAEDALRGLLSAEESGGLVTWLNENDYKLPRGAERQSVTIFWVMPVASSVSSLTEIPEIRSTNFAVPAFSAMIGSV